MKFDDIVIGGGPAGLAAAIRLARIGRKVMLVEQRHLPQRKCCGEFLHPSAVHELGLLLRDFPQGETIRRLFLSSGRIQREFYLPRPAMSLKREILSSALLDAAILYQVRIVTGQTATVDSVSEDAVEIRVGTDRYSAEILILAEGSASRNARRLGLTHPAHSPAYGFSMRVPDKKTSSVELAAIQGGYVGLCSVGSGISNIAGLLTPSAYHRLSPHKSNFAKRLWAEIPTWTDLVPNDARADLFQVPAGTRGIGNKCRLQERIRIVGDAAGMGETAFGDGIARSLRHARFLEESTSAFLTDLKSRARAYFHSIQSDIHQPNRYFLKFVGHLLRTPAVAAMVLRLPSPWLEIMIKKATAPAQATPNVLNNIPTPAHPRTT